jgi:hypothetical protein
LERIYVNVIMHKLALPDVDWYTFHGVSVADGSLVMQKVIRHK